MMKKTNKRMGCEYCENCIPIGEGDHICDEMDEPIIVLEDYAPSADYFACNGKCFKRN